MKNRLSDLNGHLFAQLERLSDEDMTDDQVAVEAKRGKAIVAVADKIIKNAALRIEATKLASEYVIHSHSAAHVLTIEGRKSE